MMDDKRLQEIKARANLVVKNHEDWSVADAVMLAGHDVPKLIAEVERLAKCRRECKIECLLGEYEKLHAENTRLRAELEAAKYDLWCAGLCENCKHVYNDECYLVCGESDSPYRWEWRGLCAENGGDPDAA